MKLPDAIQRRVAAGVLSAGHARAILSTGDPERMEALAEKIINEDLSVRAAEEAASAFGRPARKKAPVEGPRHAHWNEVAERLGDRLNTRVQVSVGARKGKITIDFASPGDLKRILEELGEPGIS